MTTERTTLVTGGAGFIGSHLVERLVARGDRVVVIDDLSTGAASNLAAVDRSRLTLVRATVSQALPRFEPGRFDDIYHLAAAVGVRLVIERPIHTIETNIRETSAILEFASCSPTPTLIASTSEVYGKSPKTPMAEDDDVVYGPTTYSRWSYASSKAIDEYLALAHRRQYGLPVVIARFFNTIGPRQVGEYGMVLPRFIRAALDGRPIEVYGDGRQTRCFCDVRDVVGAIVRLVESCASPLAADRSQSTDDGEAIVDVPPIFNIGSDDLISIGELAVLVRDTLGSDSAIVHVPYELAFGQAFDDLRSRQPHLGRIREAVAFAPRITLVQSIRDMAAEMKQSSGSRRPMSETPGAPTACHLTPGT
jgi:UDP-glucose 4-epimerase